MLGSVLRGCGHSISIVQPALMLCVSLFVAPSSQIQVTVESGYCEDSLELWLGCQLFSATQAEPVPGTTTAFRGRQGSRRIDQVLLFRRHYPFSGQTVNYPS